MQISLQFDEFFSKNFYVILQEIYITYYYSLRFWIRPKVRSAFIQETCWCGKYRCPGIHQAEVMIQYYQGREAAEKGEVWRDNLGWIGTTRHYYYSSHKATDLDQESSLCIRISTHLLSFIGNFIQFCQKFMCYAICGFSIFALFSLPKVRCVMQ